MGHCERCSKRISSQHISRNQLFLKHIVAINNIVKRKRPDIQILMWDDYFRTLSKKEIENDREIYSLFKFVVWWYGNDVHDELGPSLWDTYSKVLTKTWISSAYKGTAGSDKYLVNVNHYIQNQLSWLGVVREHRKKINFEGVILTGWQRFDHFGTLSELLPVAIPALTMTLRLLQGFNHSALRPSPDVVRFLQCDQPFGLMGSAFGSPKCKYPGAAILENFITLQKLQMEFSEIVDDPKVKRWFGEFNRAYSVTNPKFVKMDLTNLNKIKNELEAVKVGIYESMNDVYDVYTVDEWVRTYLAPFEREVNVLWEAKQQNLGKTHWPRNPLNFNNVTQFFGPLI